MGSVKSAVLKLLGRSDTTSQTVPFFTVRRASIALRRLSVTFELADVQLRRLIDEAM